ncbi:hypothetical protein [Streptomyces sp. NPDC096153]|uniref:hypothetical protein n=1 Tax=Streptomyces sp. NPDC096153 TaxID=3155548 RepID=UPI0033318366
MPLNVAEILDKIVSHAMATGLLEKVNGHEPDNAPPPGLTAAVWADQIEPVRASGLDSVTTRLVFNVRLYSSLQVEPADAIDPALIDAVDTLCAAYVGDFTLGGLVRDVDIFGTYGTPLSTRAGYLQQAGVMYRVMTISLPVVVNDLWSEAP